MGGCLFGSKPTGHIRSAKRTHTPAGQKYLPRRFDDTRNLAGEGEFTEGDTRNAEFTDVSARTTTHGTAVFDAHLRRVAGKLLELLLRGEEVLVRGPRVEQRGLQLSALGGELGRELLALDVAMDGRGLGHDKKD